MRTVEIDPDKKDEMLSVAREESEEIGSLNGSIEDGDGNVAGLFGELLFCEFIGGVRDNTYNYDIDFDGTKIDVKTKRRTVDPKTYYECSISDFNTSQDCDLYYFVSVRESYDRATLLGCLTPDEYYDKAEFHEEGDVDPDNGFVFKDDCWNVPIYQLRSEVEL